MSLNSPVISSPSYLLIMDEVSATVTYVGEAIVGSLTSQAVWKIKKLTVSGTITSVQYADGDSTFDNIWDDRVSLTYG